LCYKVVQPSGKCVCLCYELVSIVWVVLNVVGYADNEDDDN